MKTAIGDRLFFKVVYTALQFSWGIVQTLLGFVVFLLNIKSPHHFFCGCVVTTWKRKSSLSLGEFIFCTDDPFCYYPAKKSVFKYEQFYSMYEVHEYGHTVQSLIFGPLYLFVVGISSISWAMLPCFVKLRYKKSISYFAVFPENQANSLGEKITGKKSPGLILND